MNIRRSIRCGPPMTRKVSRLFVLGMVTVKSWALNGGVLAGRLEVQLSTILTTSGSKSGGRCYVDIGSEGDVLVGQTAKPLDL